MDVFNTFSTIEDLLRFVLDTEIETVHTNSNTVGVPSVASARECLKVKAKCGQDLNIFLKIRRSGSVTEQIDNVFKIFQREIAMYGEIIPVLDKFLLQFQDKSGSSSVTQIFPKYYGCGLVGRDLYLVFEDILTDSDKYVTGRQDFDHSHQQIVSTLEQLGKFHASSFCYQKITKTNLEEQFPILEEPVYHPDRVDHLRSMFQGTFLRHINLLLIVLKGRQCGNEIVESNITTACQERDLQTMLTRADTLMEEIFSLLTTSKHKLLTHGDFHMWNIAFGPTRLTFFDLQSCRVSSGASDIVQYLYQVTTPATRHKHLPEYVQHYCGAFRTLATTILGEEDNSLEACDEEWVLSEVKRMSLFGVMFGIDFILPRFMDDAQLFSVFTDEDLVNYDSENVKKIIQDLDKSGENVWWAVQTMFDIVHEFII